MREALEQTDKVSYYSFLMSLAKHETINQTIGRFNISHYPGATASSYKIITITFVHKCTIVKFVYKCTQFALQLYIIIKQRAAE